MSNFTKFTLFIVLSVLISCKEGETKNTEQDDIVKPNDTITTSSGLKYFYLKKGNGRKIQTGAEVKTYTDLYIKETDSLIWSTSVEIDSTFKFIFEDNTFIKGFSELNKYLVEGDEVVAILPDSLAYGKETLVYNPYIIKSVSIPKINIADSLLKIAKTNTGKDAISFYENIKKSNQKDKYHTDIDLIYYSLFKRLNNDSLYAQTIFIADYFENKTEDHNVIEYSRTSRISSLTGQGRIKEAIIKVEQYLKEEDLELWKNKLIELKKMLE